MSMQTFIFMRSRNIGLFLILCAVLLITGLFGLRQGWELGRLCIVLFFITLLSSIPFGVFHKRLIPDICYGFIDGFGLALPALVGSRVAGISGAVVGAVLGDALTDGIAGYFEGTLAEWFRSKGWEEARTAQSSSIGKMSGSFLGASVVFLIFPSLTIS